MCPRSDTIAKPMPLADTLVGQTVRFVGVDDPTVALTHRLAELGLTPGERLEVINRGPGPFIVSVRGARLLLGRGMAGKVLVRAII
jgi:Fe2+ transport system protein FeoA